MVEHFLAGLVRRTVWRSAAGVPPGRPLDSTPMYLRRDWLLQRLVNSPNQMELRVTRDGFSVAPVQPQTGSGVTTRSE